MSLMPDLIDQGFSKLARQGLNLWATFDTAVLPEPIRTPMLQSGVPLDDYGRLLLLAHGGQQFWTAAQHAIPTQNDPLDHFSIQQAQRFLEQFAKTTDYLIVYPLTAYWIPLQQLGELAGWANPSPIGSGINPTYGLWFAYRVALLTNAPLPLSVVEKRPSPCTSCTDKPCQTACPAGAVHPQQQLHLQACGDYRLETRSPCADRCLARLACPVAPEHRYTEEQLRYHYLHSLKTLREWRDKA